MEHIPHIIIYSDGGSRGNPGQAAYGFVISDADKKIVFREGKRIGIATNNVAEYMGILSALEWIDKNVSSGIKKIECFMDSELVAKQLSGEYRVKNPTLSSLFLKIGAIQKRLNTPIVFTHVRREKNTEADYMVNQALDGKI